MATKDKPVYMISIVAKMLEVHPQTLRLYEREGLVMPSRTDGNTRLYSQHDVERVEKVLNLTRDLGVNLAGVDIILRLKERIQDLEQSKNACISAFIQFLEKKIALKDFELRNYFLELVQEAVEQGILDTTEPSDGEPRAG